MKKLVLAAALAVVVMLTGCSSTFPDLYSKYALDCITGIGEMTLDEAKSLAEERGYEFDDFASNQYKVSPAKGDNYVLVSVQNGVVSSVEFTNRKNETNLKVNSNEIVYINLDKEKVEWVDTLSAGERLIFGNSTGTSFTVEEKPKSSTTSTISNPVITEYNYDNLQNLFISITSLTTEEELKEQIEEKSLCYTSQDYNSSLGKEVSYKIAYTQGAAVQKYADSGDYLTVTFGKSDKVIRYAKYVNAECSLTALYYNYGYWGDFSEKSLGSYSGYYLIDPMAKNTGITIKYKNGNEKATNYFKRDSAESAIRSVLSGI